jgi:hypothetical protein
MTKTDYLFTVNNVSHGWYRADTLEDAREAFAMDFGYSDWNLLKAVADKLGMAVAVDTTLTAKP